MKTPILPFVFAGLLLLVPASLSAAAFEGKVTMKMTDPGSKGEAPLMQLSLKQGFYRMDVTVADNRKKNASESMATIMDLTKMEMYILMPSEKMYMVQKINPRAGNSEKVETVGDVVVERTGKTETILGYRAEQYLVKTKDGTSEIWATDQLGTYMGSSAPGGGGGRGMFGRGGGNASEQEWEKAFTGRDFFPLRVVSLDRRGRETSRMEVVAIEKQSLDVSHFAPPADFQRFGMGNMLKGALPGFGR
jgi:hypothetical protein